MARPGVDGLIVSDPINIRYAVGARDMQVFSMRNAPACYLLLTADRSVLYEFTGCLHLAGNLETVDEVRPARTASLGAAGPHIAPSTVVPRCSVVLSRCLTASVSARSACLDLLMLGAVGRIRHRG
jgi:hypothetical protein